MKTCTTCYYYGVKNGLPVCRLNPPTVHTVIEQTPGGLMAKGSVQSQLRVLGLLPPVTDEDYCSKWEGKCQE